MTAALINLLIALLIGGLIAGLIIWLIDTLPIIPATFKQFAKATVIVIVIILILLYALPLLKVG